MSIRKALISKLTKPGGTMHDANETADIVPNIINEEPMPPDTEEVVKHADAIRLLRCMRLYAYRTRKDK